MVDPDLLASCSAELAEIQRLTALIAQAKTSASQSDPQQSDGHACTSSSSINNSSSEQHRDPSTAAGPRQAAHSPGALAQRRLDHLTAPAGPVAESTHSPRTGSGESVASLKPSPTLRQLGKASTSIGKFFRDPVDRQEEDGSSCGVTRAASAAAASGGSALYFILKVRAPVPSAAAPRRTGTAGACACRPAASSCPLPGRALHQRLVSTLAMHWIMWACCSWTCYRCLPCSSCSGM